MGPNDLAALWVTLRLALTSTLLLLLLGTPVAWWLARSHSRVRTLVETVIALPLVLPPTVLGFYLLIALSPNGSSEPAGLHLGGLGWPSPLPAW